MKKKKDTMAEINQTNGALSQARSVYDIIGKANGPYTTNSFDVYRTQLQKMDLAELQKHAIETANIIPIDDRRRLEDRLEKEFLRTQAKFAGKTQGVAPMSEKDKDSVLKILSRAR